MASVSSQELNKAIKSLEFALAQPKSDIARDAAIQRFEFCMELAWKVARKKMGTITTAPKQVIREMGQNGFIEDVNLWLEAIDYRNLSSHTYDEILAEKVFSFIVSFFSNLQDLAAKLS